MPIDAKRVIERRNALGLSQGDLAEALRMSQQGIADIESGKVKRPRKLKELAEVLKTSQEYLLSESNDEGLTTSELIPAKGVIPVIGEVAAGLWLEIDLAQDPLEWLPFVPILGFDIKSIFGLRVRGNSVDKIAPHGSILICVDLFLTGLGINDGDLVITEHRKEQEGVRQVTVKRVHKRRGGYELAPESTDPYWKPLFLKGGLSGEIDGEEIRVIARVEWITQKPPQK